MNNFQINRALAEMRALAAQAGSQTKAAERTAESDFGDAMKQALGTVNALQQDSGDKQAAFVRGENIALTDVMIASQKSKVAFEAVKQVRNHLLEAYRTVSNMQV
ncbi:flagellar hook-basal body complex protein FliE [Alkalilimnicola sp. S0819]|uniref:flagellar hook-basal body complex protein FliE n=1 Tax=Alkalilimnicola sp. S0819 TaxID=2613922 RepID=UPI0012622E61|nr:flagellar hook-basal body complex protein FliE [Alkalilimnicola sp. S0819]KAB7627183.1 flagellar hook-basal body complex protein FliE [Alkalilimnicola sp. S0819]MPQ15895.1 flagellar hook-basal body complex protein FliE [Alkalilimnicola sp. S0819]